jgi:hypothetical protein
VDADLLNAEQVLTSSNAAGDGDIVGGCAILAICPISVSIMNLPFMSQLAWLPEKVGPIRKRWGPCSGRKRQGPGGRQPGQR